MFEHTVIVGLGNPGDEYRETPHNIGFSVIDYWIKRDNLSWNKEREYHFVAPEGKNYSFIKPMTYMNCSGQPLRLYLKKIEKPFRLLVMLDNIDLPLGKVRFRKRGSDGGHRGLRSILSFYEGNFFCVWIGVGRGQSQDLVSYVLSPFRSKEKQFVQDLMYDLIDDLELFLQQDFVGQTKTYLK